MKPYTPPVENFKNFYNKTIFLNKKKKFEEEEDEEPKEIKEKPKEIKEKPKEIKENNLNKNLDIMFNFYINNFINK